MERLRQIRHFVHRHVHHVHQYRTAMEAVCFTAVACGVHEVEVVMSGALGVVCVVVVAMEVGE